MQQNENGYQVVSTKVSNQCFQSLHLLAKKKGLTVYELIQMVCDVLVRYMDDRHNLTPEMEKVMSLFEHMAGWKAAFNLADPKSQPEVQEATYFMSSTGKNGIRAVHVEKPFMGTWTQNYNVTMILERTVCLLNNELYKRLRLIGLDLGTTNVLETLVSLIDEHSKESDLQAMRQDFEDAKKNDFGKEMPNIAPQRRVHQTIDMFKDDKEYAQ